MRIALDTNAYVALHQGDAVLAEYARIVDTIGMPVVVVAELRFGFFDGGRPGANETALSRFLETPRVELLNITVSTTQLFGEIATVLRRDGKAIQQNDIWIAALCKQYDFPLASRDDGFDHVVGLSRVPF